MSLHKPSHEEDEYFALENALRRYRLARERALRTEVEERQRQAALHFMKCPKCGFDLEPVLFHGVTIDKCFRCDGSWLDAGELEQLAGKEPHVLRDIISLFKH